MADIVLKNSQNNYEYDNARAFSEGIISPFWENGGISIVKKYCASIFWQHEIDTAF